jgi:hypothetical protein
MRSPVVVADAPDGPDARSRPGGRRVLITAETPVVYLLKHVPPGITFGVRFRSRMAQGRNVGHGALILGGEERNHRGWSDDAS